MKVNDSLPESGIWSTHQITSLLAQSACAPDKETIISVRVSTIKVAEEVLEKILRMAMMKTRVY